MTRKHAVLLCLLFMILLLPQGCKNRRSQPYERLNVSSKPMEIIPQDADTLVRINMKDLMQGAFAREVALRYFSPKELLATPPPPTISEFEQELKQPVMAPFEGALPMTDTSLVFDVLTARELRLFYNNFGIAPFRDAQEIYVAVYNTYEPQNRDWVLVAVGRFDDVAAMRQMEKTANKWTEMEYGDYRYFELEAGRLHCYLRFVSPQALIVTSRNALMCRMIETYKGKGGGVNQDPYLHPLISLASNDAKIWLVGKAHPRFAESLDTGMEWWDDLDEQASAIPIQEVKDWVIELDFDPQVRLMLRCRGNFGAPAEKLAANMAQRRSGWLETITSLGKKKGDEDLARQLRKFMECIEVSAEGGDMILTFPYGHEDFRKLDKFIAVVRRYMNPPPAEQAPAA
ncbi:hypothetical protein JXA32_01395 [Candidatus Sumerlaeota bacterium]|nr:hypothetical protein [Candidatus Sumerlaeota bacterium]